MPGIKGLNCSDTTSTESDSASNTVCEEGWKFYDNPFFVAAVASAVVEATLNSGGKLRRKQEAGEHRIAIEKKTVEPKNEASKKVKNLSMSTPRTGRQSPTNVTSKSPEMKKKPNIAGEDTTQKLRVELLKAWTTIDRLETAHAAAKLKAERLSTRLQDSRTQWESQVQDKFTSSLQALKHKLKEEKNANKNLELANQKLETELGEIRKAIATARKDLVSEKHAKRMIEDVCDELAREVGEDRALVIELRRHSTTARREADDTRKALQMGEVWKEEKVQGRLTEARYEIEHRSMELNQMISRVESFLEEKEATFQGQEFTGCHGLEDVMIKDRVVTSNDTEEASNSLLMQDKLDVMSCSSSCSSGFSLSEEKKKAYREQTRHLLNGSGFHMMRVMNNKAYSPGGGGINKTRPTAAASETNKLSGKPVVPRIWPTTNKNRKNLS